MTTFDEIKDKLEAKLDKSHVQPPKQYGPKGDYLEGWHVIAEANRIFGFNGWSYEVIETTCVANEPRKIGRDKKDGFGVTYISKVRVMAIGVGREDYGSGHGYDVDLGLAHESAVKEAVTDALKRALRTFGNQFGLALYDKSHANVTDDKASEQPKPISAAEQNLQLTLIDDELLDCDTISKVKACAEGWKSIAIRDGWSRDYQLAAADKFKAKREELEKQDDFPGSTEDAIKSQFPGAHTVNEQHVLEAGE